MLLEKGSFGSTTSILKKGESWGWYKQFAESERAADCPADAYTTILLPLLPAPHVALLQDLLELLSGVAAHAQGNGMFNTKLAKDLAWWVISSRRWEIRDDDGWSAFYLAWERAARILEHVMLAYLRFVFSSFSLFHSLSVWWFFIPCSVDPPHCSSHVLCCV
ncbi:hypothetical protein DL93DRAFT_1574501 [Clavulina sp. PMI_390]|nr:hypothetical protein DL93DRAFT_1574501 [Clavulina sp. PMI_390]